MLCYDDPFSLIERRFLVPKPVDLAAEDGREVARAAAWQGLLAMPSMAEIYPVGGEHYRCCWSMPPLPLARSFPACL